MKSHKTSDFREVSIGQRSDHARVQILVLLLELSIHVLTGPYLFCHSVLLTMTLDSA